ncbi:MAG: GNAT family N-acetyltransferase [Oxalobacteraceae bacterium]|nr:MAG: GNAT family N-acetyltransferase [Oxalobacteraceae bacterium]
MSQLIVYRSARPDDALMLSVLATQVFLDTYATRGVSLDFAREATTVYSLDAFVQRLQQPGVEITVATSGESLVGFLDLDWTTQCPVPSVQGLEVLRLYVQAPFQRCGVGKALMSLAERKARERRAPHVWLTAWSGNDRARAFYVASGYTDVGVSQHVIEGTAYENRVFAKRTPERAD